jgi:hypothetical protein
VVFHADSLLGYADGDWLEFAPRMMDTWVDEEITKNMAGTYSL